MEPSLCQKLKLIQARVAEITRKAELNRVFGPGSAVRPADQEQVNIQSTGQGSSDFTQGKAVLVHRLLLAEQSSAVGQAALAPQSTLVPVACIAQPASSYSIGWTFFNPSSRGVGSPTMTLTGCFAYHCVPREERQIPQRSFSQRESYGVYIL